MIVKRIEDDDTINYFLFFNKRNCRITFSKGDSKRLFFKNISDNVFAADSFECHNLKKQDYYKIFNYITSLYNNIVFELYFKEDILNIKELCKYGLKQTGGNRFEYKRDN